MARSLIDMFVYWITKKPLHYVEVKNPPKTVVEKIAHPQDARQVQYNEWSKRFKVYSGSYLPDDGSKLTTRGWEDSTHSVIKNNRPTNKSKFYRRKSTNQWVRDDVTHWHWYNWWNRKLNHKAIRSLDYTYFDMFGVPTKKGSIESHLERTN